MKTVFVVAAHPDDEVLGCGGTLLKHVDEGDKVYVLFVTEGVSGRYKKKETNQPLKEISKRKKWPLMLLKLENFK